MPPTGKATPLKVPANGFSSFSSPLTPRTPGFNVKPKNEATGIEEAGDAATVGISSPLELTTFVDTVLKQLESKFTTMSQGVLDKMDEMSNRIDQLEMSLQDLLSSDLTASTESPRRTSTGLTYSNK